MDENGKLCELLKLNPDEVITHITQYASYLVIGTNQRLLFNDINYLSQIARGFSLPPKVKIEEFTV